MKAQQQTNNNQTITIISTSQQHDKAKVSERTLLHLAVRGGEKDWHFIVVSFAASRISLH